MNKRKEEVEIRPSEALVEPARLIAPEGSANLSDDDPSYSDFLISTEELESFDVAQS